MNNKNLLIIVDENDQQIGLAEKISTHRNRQLHRAFSIFIFNRHNQLLMQKRALDKYHSGGVWSNTCCSHPVSGESLLSRAQMRLQEEMGFTCELQKAFVIRYDFPLNNELFENELTHVFYGRFDGDVALNAAEACDYCWVDQDEIANMQPVSPWFSLMVNHQSGLLFELGKTHVD